MHFPGDAEVGNVHLLCQSLLCHVLVYQVPSSVTIGQEGPPWARQLSDLQDYLYISSGMQREYNGPIV